MFVFRHKFYSNTFLVNKGFHSYSHRINTISKCINEYVQTNWERYEIAFCHKVEVVDQCRRGSYFYDFYIAECHIPAGSTLYSNEFGEYVSDRIVIDKLLDIEELYQVFKSIEEFRKAHNL